MNKVLITCSKLNELASTIAEKSGVALPLTIDQMDAAVDGIAVGGAIDGDDIAYGGAYAGMSAVDIATLTR